MKQSTLLLLASLFAAQIFAQITIERPDYTYTTNGGTVHGWIMSPAGLSLPAEGADVTWDYSGQALTAPFNYVKNPVSEPLFPDANLVEYSTGLALGIAPQGVNFYEQLAEDGYKVLGRTTTAMDLPSQPLTGGPNDTISFLGAVNVYEEPNYYLKFPLIYEDSWDTEINIAGNYLMTVQAFGLDHVPASSNYNYQSTNTVAGYGTLILPHPDGVGTVSLEALLLKETTLRTDSFFLAGQPAPQIMLSALGLVQGNTATYSDYSFYAKGLNRSALYLEGDSGQITSATMADDVKNIVSSTKFVSPELIATSVFPNPVSGNFQVEFEKPDAQAWTFELYNPLGKMIFSKQLEGTTGKMIAKYALPRSANAGLYHFVLRNAKGVVMANGHLMVK